MKRPLKSSLAAHVEVWRMLEEEIADAVAAAGDENEEDRNKRSVDEVLEQLNVAEVRLDSKRELRRALGLTLAMLAYYDDQLGHLAWLIQKRHWSPARTAKLLEIFSLLSRVFTHTLAEMVKEKR